MGRDDDLYRKAGYNYGVLKQQQDREQKEAQEKAKRKEADRRGAERWARG